MLLFDKKPFSNLSVQSSQIQITQVKLHKSISTRTPKLDLLKRKFIASPSLDSHFNPTSCKKLCKSPLVKSIRRASISSIDSKEDKNNEKSKTQGVANLFGIANKKTELKNKQNLLNTFGKKQPTKIEANVIEEKIEKTKHDSYTYDLDEVLKNADIMNELNKSKKENNNTSSVTKKTTEKLPSDELKFVSCKEFNGFEFEKNSQSGSSDEVKLGQGVKRNQRNNLLNFVSKHVSFTDVEKQKELTLNKRFNQEDHDIFPAFRHNLVPPKKKANNKNEGYLFFKNLECIIKTK